MFLKKPELEEDAEENTPEDIAPKDDEELTEGETRRSKHNVKCISCDIIEIKGSSICLWRTHELFVLEYLI